ncbi:MAG TPA: phosphate signaling complex protein PhoU [Actinomycetota bacterium]|nr:phosphate signaling complex protein PhoU [Actinomycetota bacterium]
MPRSTRVGFHEALAAAEDALMREGSLVKQQLENVMRAVVERDEEMAERVIRDDDRVDELYLAAETGVINLLALQAPVASDLRLVSVIMHSNIHVERMGDLCVNIAKFVKARHPYPSDSPMVERLSDMGGRCAEMLEAAMNAFAQRDVDMAETLPQRDNAIDRLNRGMLDELKSYAGDERAFEWAVNLILAARYLERFGDHCVDVAEQIAFLVTGVFREFTDASHPEYGIG